MDKSVANQLISAQLTESAETKLRMSETLSGAILTAAEVVAKAFQQGNKVLFCGNGGSAADAQHLATEFTGQMRPGAPRAPLPAIALTTDTSALTAIGNDFGFDLVFARQVEALGRPGDVLIAISTSGNSRNVIKAVEAAKQRNIQVIGFLGMGGALADLVDYPIQVPNTDVPRIQEGHITVGHILCDLVERMLLSPD